MISEELDNFKNATNEFSYFIKNIFPLSFDLWVDAPHLQIWAKRIQFNKKTTTLSARKHLKSTLMYAYVMWRLFRCVDHSESWYYMSYTEPLSYYHTQNIKLLIKKNPFFKEFNDLTHAEGILKYSVDGKNIFKCSPAGILSFNRGWHGYGVICDDVLADPENELNPGIIHKINKTFFEEVMSLPIEGGETHLVGTAQHSEDLFFTIKKRSPSFDWAMYKAIINESTKEVLWTEMFPYERLNTIRLEEIGEKAFSKEYMCSPVWSENAFLTRDQVLNVVNNQLKNDLSLEKTRFHIITAGWDIGKHVHPSHFTIFLRYKDKYIQIWQEFFDNMDYNKQLKKVKELVETAKVDRVYYDATRGELESFVEQGLIDKNVFKPVIFKVQTKSAMASNFEKLVINKGIELINNERMIGQILAVNNNLDAIETPEGHGDSFWSISMALSEGLKKPSVPYLA